MPDYEDRLSKFERMCVVKTFREDRTLIAAADYISDALGQVCVRVRACVCVRMCVFAWLVMRCVGCVCVCVCMCVCQVEI